jgi:hypothetical protein
MRRTTKAAMLALPILAAGGVALPGLATASSPSSSTSGIPPLARTRAETAINVRITAVDAALTVVKQTGWFAGSDQGSLENILSGDLDGNGQEPGLNALLTTIKNETDSTKFEAEVKSIYGDYRIYALALPQVHLVRANDRLSVDTVPTLEQLSGDLKTAIAQEATEGKDVTAAQEAVKDMDAQISTIQQKTGGTSAGLLALTPADWNANHGVVLPFRQDVRAAAAAAKQARQDGRAALKDLQ